MWNEGKVRMLGRNQRPAKTPGRLQRAARRVAPAGQRPPGPQPGRPPRRPDLGRTACPARTQRCEIQPVEIVTGGAPLNALHSYIHNRQNRE